MTNNYFSDPSTADNSLDLDDMYRAKPPTIVVDNDGDLWRRQGTDGGSRVWVLVREEGVAPLGYTPAIASSSRRLLDRFGPIAYAPAADVKAALAQGQHDVECVLGGDDDPDPSTAPAEPDADALDRAVSAALDAACGHLLGEADDVEVRIRRDTDGEVDMTVVTTEKVEG